MKIIGLLTAWACEDWIEISIKQALDLVDELIIAIGAYDKYFQRIEDKTYDIARKYLNHKKIKVVSIVRNPALSRKQNRAETFNHMLKASENIKKGNLLWILDVDEFYSKESIEEIMDYIESNKDFDEIKVVARFFCINLNYYILFTHGRILKITDDNPYFTPTQKINPRPKKIITLLHENPMFHYSMLTGEQLKGILWLLDDFIYKFMWYRKIYNNYDPQNEEIWMQKNQELTGNFGFWITKEDAIEKNGHGLFHYNEKHPDLIESSPLKKISDYRIYMKEKPNYKIYLKVVNQIIAEKNEINLQRILTSIKDFIIWQKYFVKIKIFLDRNRRLKRLLNKVKKRNIYENNKYNRDIRR